MHESVEDYLNAIYRLRAGAKEALPLSQLQEFFGFSRVSIHEMIKKLETRELVSYQPYHGVILTATGEEIAQAVLRRHRIWEKFLTEILAVPWDEAHKFAEQLEHAAPEEVTERLAERLDNTEGCSLATTELLGKGSAYYQRLVDLAAGAKCRIAQVEPETPKLLHQLQELQLNPTSKLQIIQQRAESTLVLSKGNPIHIPTAVARTIWVTTTNTAQGEKHD